MNLAHLHLLLNHLPTVGFGFAIALCGASLVRTSEDLRRASFVAFYAVALAAIPAYLTGNAAQFVLQQEPGVSPEVIAAHQNAAMLALIPMGITGLMAWWALWRYRRWNLPAVLVLSIVTFVLMARAATIGGHIRHPEILAAGASVYAPAWPSPATMGAAFVLDNPWVWPICEVFHFVGLCLLFGVVLLVNLRMLGVIGGVSLTAVNRLLPWAMAGLVINVATGFLFFLASPDQYTQNSAFAWKIALVALGGLTLLYPPMFDEETSPPADLLYAPGARKVVAAGSICVWIAVIFLGRFLPYLGSE